jgi:hypothetical protein
MRIHILCALLLAGCSDDASPTDSGPRTDAGPRADGGSRADSGSDPSLDAGARDASTLRDAGDLEITELERMLIDMPADSWMRVPTGLRTACTTREDDEWHAVSGCGGIFAFSGGVWDPDDRLMLIFGGGHADYAGNEIYGFSTRTLTWERLTEPSPGPYDRDPLEDGTPVSRHTYDGIAWLTHSHRMWTWSGSRALSGSGTDVAWTFEPLARRWTNVTDAETPSGSLMTSSVYDPVTERLYIKSGERFIIHDPEAHTWSQPHDFGIPPLWPRYAGGQARGVFDSLRRLIFWFGTGLYMIYDIDADAFVTDDWITTGGGTFSNLDDIGEREGQNIETGGAVMIDAADPGMDYDVAADQIVGWNGEELWVLDLASKTWTERTAEGAPTDGTGRIYGRFRYIDALNVFVLVDGLDAVYFYKNTAGP